MSVTIDASVFVTAARATEDQHAISRAFLERLDARQVSTYCPVLNSFQRFGSFQPKTA